MAEGYEAKIRELEADIQAKIEWARDVETALTAEIGKQTANLGRPSKPCTTRRRNCRSARSGRYVQYEVGATDAAVGARPRLALGQAGPQGRPGPGAARLTCPS